MANRTKQGSVRLPAHVVADRYSLKFKPDLESFTFTGEEAVSVTLHKPTRTITLHSKDLEIEMAEYVTGQGGAVFAGEISYDEKAETATFAFPKALPKGKGELRLAFRGILNDRMRGFYRSRYDVGGQPRYMATTQFEATDARRAFPCFDEPAHKSVFEIALVIPNHMSAISNTIESGIAEVEAGYKIVKFTPSPKMSTYLLAFIVGEFEFIEGKTRDGVVVRVFTTPGKKHQAGFALETAIRCLEFYNEYFGIPYPLPTLDMIAVPDFTAGAMENWGAVTYRESALLVDAQNTSIANKQWVAIVIAHELAHQWFGNLVTMEWWTHLWLNEGFASYMENFCVDKLFPEWGIWNEYVSGRYKRALTLDSLDNTHPIEVEVRHPDEIHEIFDMISYAKGSAVVRMLAEHIGHEKFRDGLRLYLKKFEYGNASTEQLWDSFEKVSKKPVRELMKNWTNKPGHPVISVQRKPKGLKLVQRRYFASSLSQAQSRDKTVWQIPFKVAGENFSQPLPEVLVQKSKIIHLPKANNAGWFKLNAGETGFFRTFYSKEMLESLKVPIEQKKLSTVDRVGLVRDAFALAESGEMSTVDTLELVKAYRHDTDYVAWLEIASGLGAVRQLIFGQPYQAAFEVFAREVFAGIAGQMGWKPKEGERETRALLRSLALYNYGTYGGMEAVKRAKEYFVDLSGQGSVPADLRGVVYGLAAEYGGKREFEFLMDRYRKESFHEEKDRIGRSLGKFKNPKLLERVLDFSISKNVRLQDAPFIIVSVWANPYGREIAWQFTKRNWNKFLDLFGEGLYMSRILGAADTYASEARAKEMEKFFKKNPAPGAERTVQQVVEKIRSNAAWLKRDGKQLASYFKK